MTKLNSLSTMRYRKFTGDNPEPVQGVETHTGKDGATSYKLQLGRGEDSPLDPLLKPNAKNRHTWQA